MADFEEWNEEINLRAREDRLEQDIVVLEEVNSVPVLNTEYHTHYYYIGMCLSGRTVGQYNYRDTDFKAGDICWIMPDHIISHQYVSDDYRVLSIYISKSLFQKFKDHGALGKFHYPMKAVIVSLQPEQFDLIANGFKMMGKLAALEHPQRIEMLCSMCHIISSVCDEFIRQQQPHFSQQKSPNEELFERFYETLVSDYRISREVAYYADKFCLTPKYFATVIKHTTGIPASEWINRYVIVEAKWLLRTKKSIQQIGLYLGFSEQASFSRFFKANTKMTPSEYREHCLGPKKSI